MKHTPGPWSEAEYCIGTIKASDDIGVAYVADKFRNKTEFEANTRLIIAAPELVKVVENALECFRPSECNCDGEYNADGRITGHACYFHRIEDELRSALRTATGGKP